MNEHHTRAQDARRKTTRRRTCDRRTCGRWDFGPAELLWGDGVLRYTYSTTTPRPQALGIPYATFNKKSDWPYST